MISVVRTLFDLEQTLGTHLCRVNRWILPRPGGRSEVDHAIDRLFSGRERLCGDDRARLADAYLECAAEPLDRIHALGLQIVALISTGNLVLRARRRRPDFVSLAIDMADYIVAPDPCYFRPARADFSGPIHRLGADCLEGHQAIVDSGAAPTEKQFSIWTSYDWLLEDFERVVPWCPACRDHAEGLTG